MVVNMCIQQVIIKVKTTVCKLENNLTHLNAVEVSLIEGCKESTSSLGFDGRGQVHSGPGWREGG